MAAPRPTKLLSICDWLPPDFGAVGQYALAEARRRAEGGADVTLVGLASRGSSVEAGEGDRGRLRVVRVKARPYDRSNFLERALWTRDTNRALVRAAAPYAAGADEILFTGSPPLFLHWIVPANRRWKKKLVYRITDFHPECLIAERGNEPWWLALLKARTLRLRRRVDRFEVLGEDQRRRLLGMGIAPGKIELRRDESPVSFEGALPMMVPAELGAYRVLLYSGNFGVAHDVDTFLEAYENHHRGGTGRVALWLNATGAKADRLESELRKRLLPIHRSPPVPLEQLPELLVTPAAHLITLRDEFVGYVLPSKVYGCIASGKPVLFVGSVESDVDRLCRERIPRSYRRAAVGDVAAVERALDEIGRGALP